MGQGCPQNQPTSIGRYEVERLLGAGGMGAVYLARDPNIGRQVAIKVLRTDDDEYRRRFKIEVNAAGALRHRNIGMIFDSGEHDGSPFLAMEFIPGETLADKIKRKEPLPVADKLRYIEELCEGLAHAHKAGIVHRDIKPANVIVDGDSNSVKIVDFGIARLTESAMTSMTQSGLLMGTLSYMSPEQVMGKRIDHRSDIFAVGLVLYELLSCTRAFAGGMDDGVMYRILHEEPEDLLTLVPGLDPSIVAIVSRALKKSPADRFADATAMAGALEAARARLSAPTEVPVRTSTEVVAVTAPPAFETAQPDRGVIATRMMSRRTVLGIAAALAIVALAFVAGRFGREFQIVPVNRDVAQTTPTQTTGATPAVSAPQPTPAPPPAVTEPAPTPAPATAADPVLRISGPVDVQLLLDGKPASRNPTVRPGDHTLIARLPGVIGAKPQQFRIAAGEVRTLAVDAATGTLVPGELPFPYGSVTVDGQPVTGQTRALASSLVADFVPETGATAGGSACLAQPGDKRQHRRNRRRMSPPWSRSTVGIARRIRRGFAPRQLDLAALGPQGRLRFESHPRRTCRATSALRRGRSRDRALVPKRVSRLNRTSAVPTSPSIANHRASAAGTSGLGEPRTDTA